jgi:hypothetical protein
MVTIQWDGTIKLVSMMEQFHSYLCEVLNGRWSVHVFWGTQKGKLKNFMMVDSLDFVVVGKYSKFMP